jgi:hypothetical protein
MIFSPSIFSPKLVEFKPPFYDLLWAERCLKGFVNIKSFNPSLWDRYIILTLQWRN